MHSAFSCIFMDFHGYLPERVPLFGHTPEHLARASFPSIFSEHLVRAFSGIFFLRCSPAFKEAHPST